MSKYSRTGAPAKLVSLGDLWAGNYEIAMIGQSNLAQKLPLLQQAYQDVYLKAFSLDNGEDSIHTWTKQLDDPASPVNYRIAVAGFDLSGNAPKIASMLVSGYHKSIDTGYLCYIVVAPEYRVNGLGHMLFKVHENSLLDMAEENGSPLRGWFLDCPDPSRPHDDDYDAQKRVDKYIKWGARPLPIDCTYPSSSDPALRTDGNIILAFPHPATGLYPDAQALIDTVRAIYKAYGVPNPQNDPAFKKMMREAQERMNLDGSVRTPPATRPSLKLRIPGRLVATPS